MRRSVDALYLLWLLSRLPFFAVGMFGSGVLLISGVADGFSWPLIGLGLAMLTLTTLGLIGTVYYLRRELLRR